MVSLIALSVSLPTCLATVGFFLVYLLGEDYVLVPMIIGRILKVPGPSDRRGGPVGRCPAGIVDLWPSRPPRPCCCSPEKCSTPAWTTLEHPPPRHH
jgi:hypothetical protein